MCRSRSRLIQGSSFHCLLPYRAPAMSLFLSIAIFEITGHCVMKCCIYSHLSTVSNVGISLIKYPKRMRDVGYSSYMKKGNPEWEKDPRQ